MDPAHKWYLNPMHMCMQTHAHSTYTEVTLFIPNISFLKSNQWNLWGPSVCNPATSTSISGHNTLPASLSPIYHPHISINNQVGIQLVTWKACESHVTDQSSREAAHSLRWFTAQQFVPRSAWIHAVYEAFKAGNMHLSNVPHYSGCLSHLGQLTTNQKKRRSVLSAQNPQRTEKAPASPFLCLSFPQNADIFLGLQLNAGLMKEAVSGKLRQLLFALENINTFGNLYGQHTAHTAQKTFTSLGL